MLSYTLNTSTENNARILAALNAKCDREDGETDREFYVRWLRGQHTELVVGNERRVAQGGVLADPDITEVT